MTLPLETDERAHLIFEPILGFRGVSTIGWKLFVSEVLHVQNTIRTSVKGPAFSLFLFHECLNTDNFGIRVAFLEFRWSRYK